MGFFVHFWDHKLFKKWEIVLVASLALRKLLHQHMQWARIHVKINGKLVTGTLHVCCGEYEFSLKVWWEV